MKHSSKVLGAFLAMALCLPLHAAKVYKWQDESGSWHYSEKPPLEVEPEVIKIKGETKVATDSISDDLQAKKTADGKEREESELTAPADKNDSTPLYTPEERRANCNLATERLKGLETHPRALIKDEKTGEPRYLTPDEHETWQKTSREEIKKFCKP